MHIASINSAGSRTPTYIAFEKILVRDEPGPDPVAKAEIADYRERIG